VLWSRKGVTSFFTHSEEHAVQSFLSRFGSLVLFVLSGFDRLRFIGESRLLNHGRGVQSHLWQQQILFKDFPDQSQRLTHPLTSKPKPWPARRTFPCCP
jgi:hypothetical protein